MELLRPLNDATYAGKTAAFTGTVGVCGPFASGPQGVLVTVDSAAYIRVSSDGTTATVADTFVPANTPIAFYAEQSNNNAFSVSAVQVTAGGNLYAKPINIR